MTSVPNGPRYEVVNPSPGIGEVVANFNASDLTNIAIIGGLSFPFGYLAGRPIRGPVMVMAGSIGLLGGFMYAFQSSSQRLMGLRARS